MGFATTVVLDPVAGIPGMALDLQNATVLSFQAAEIIQPGRLCQLDSTGLLVQQVQSASTVDTLPPQILGFSMAIFARENTATGAGLVYAVGDMVPILVRGSIWAEFKGTTETPWEHGTSVMNVYSSSTTATDRGKLTDAAVSASAGAEISALPSGIVIMPPVLAGSSGICRVMVNFPANQ